MSNRELYDGSGKYTKAIELKGLHLSRDPEIREYIDSFNPQDQWATAQNIHNTAIVLIDEFLPPSQTKNAQKLDKRKVPGNYTPIQIEARTPSSSLFRVGRHYLGGNENTPSARYGSTGPFGVNEFNRDGATGTVWEDSPTVVVTNEWRRRMGVKSDAWWNPQISLNNGYNINIGVQYDSGIPGTPYDGKYSEGNIADIGYAMVMLSHYFSKYGSDDGLSFVKLNVGDDLKHLLVVEKDGTDITCHMRAKKTVGIVKQLLLESNLALCAEKISEEIEFLRGQSAIDLISFAISDATSMYDYKKIAEGRSRAMDLVNDKVGFEINIPDAQLSIG